MTTRNEDEYGRVQPLVPPATPVVDESRKVVLYTAKGEALVRPVGFRA